MIFFVTEQYAKTMTVITQNVDAKDFNFLAKTNADMWVKGYIGSYFYEYLLAKFNAETLNADEIYLVEEYIKPLIAWRMASDCAFVLTNQLKNKGLQTQNGDHSNSSSEAATFFGMKHYQQKAEWYQNYLHQYLSDCHCNGSYGELYPEFISELNKHAILKPQINKYNAFGNDMLFL